MREILNPSDALSIENGASEQNNIIPFKNFIFMRIGMEMM